MSANPGTEIAEGTRGVYTGDEPNPVLKFLQRPRIMLLLLAGWSVLSALTEAFTANGIFMDNHNVEIDGAIGGLALGWEGIPLAVLYVYCFRSPTQFRGIFWLALIHMGATAASQLYHWLVTDDFTFESIVFPLAGSVGLGALVFIHLFQRRSEDEVRREALREAETDR